MIPQYLTNPTSSDVTEKLLLEVERGAYLAASSPGTRRALRAASAKKLDANLRAELEILCREYDRTMGYVSRVLIYSRIFRTPKQHSNLLRLIKGGFIRIVQVDEPPPSDTRAKRESPYSDRYFVLEPNCSALE